MPEPGAFCTWVCISSPQKLSLGLIFGAEGFYKKLPQAPFPGVKFPPGNPRYICLLAVGEVGQAHSSAEFLAARQPLPQQRCYSTSEVPNTFLSLCLLQSSVSDTSAQRASPVPTLSDLPVFLLRCILLINPATLNEPTEHPAVLEAIRGTAQARRHLLGGRCPRELEVPVPRSLSPLRGHCSSCREGDALPGAAWCGTSRPLLPHRLFEICRGKSNPAPALDWRASRVMMETLRAFCKRALSVGKHRLQLILKNI